MDRKTSVRNFQMEKRIDFRYCPVTFYAKDAKQVIF